MNKKLREQLEFRLGMYLDPHKRYDAQDFMEDWKRYQHSIEESYYLGLISDSVYEQCKSTLMNYMYVFRKEVKNND